MFDQPRPFSQAVHIGICAGGRRNKSRSTKRERESRSRAMGSFLIVARRVRSPAEAAAPGSGSTAPRHQGRRDREE